MPFCIFDRRDGNGNRKPFTALLQPRSLEVVDMAAVPQFGTNLILLIVQFRRNEPANGLADNFFRLISEYASRGFVPGDNRPVQIPADDGIVGGVDDRGEVK